MHTYDRAKGSKEIANVPPARQDLQCRAIQPELRVPKSGVSTKRMKTKSAPSRRRNSRAKPAPSDMSAARASVYFPIVAIGASAGGLEALEQFLRHVPKQCGMAFVIVTHLDPTHKGIMPELLQRATCM